MKAMSRARHCILICLGLSYLLTWSSCIALSSPPTSPNTFTKPQSTPLATDDGSTPPPRSQNGSITHSVYAHSSQATTQVKKGPTTVPHLVTTPSKQKASSQSASISTTTSTPRNRATTTVNTVSTTMSKPTSFSPTSSLQTATTILRTTIPKRSTNSTISTPIASTLTSKYTAKTATTTINQPTTQSSMVSMSTSSTVHKQTTTATATTTSLHTTRGIPSESTTVTAAVNTQTKALKSTVATTRQHSTSSLATKTTTATQTGAKSTTSSKTSQQTTGTSLKTSPLTTTLISTTAGSTSHQTTAYSKSTGNTTTVSTGKTTMSTTTTSTTVSTTPTTPGPKLQMRIFGRSVDMMIPQFLLCSVCKQHSGLDLSNCAPVERSNTKNSTDHPNLNSYTWVINEFFPSSCYQIELRWSVQYLINGTWGYYSKGKVIEGWQKEFYQRSLVRVVKTQPDPCKGGTTNIYTVWGKTELENQTCGPAIITTSPVTTINGTTPTTLPPPVTRMKWIPLIPGPWVTKEPTPRPHFGTPGLTAGHTGLIIGCSIGVVFVFILATGCGIRSYNRKMKKYLRDLNLDDRDEPPTSQPIDLDLESVTNPLYNFDSEKETEAVMHPTYTLTGDIEDIHHRSGGGVATVYDTDGIVSSGLPSPSRQSIANNNTMFNPLAKQQSTRSTYTAGINTMRLSDPGESTSKPLTNL